MALQPQAFRGGRGGGGRGGHGGRFPRQNEPRSLPCKSGKVGACKDLEQNVFTIGSGNKGKDDDLLRTPNEKLALYIYIFLSGNLLFRLVLLSMSGSWMPH
jgi:hypothetical protein